MNSSVKWLLSVQTSTREQLVGPFCTPSSKSVTKSFLHSRCPVGNASMSCSLLVLEVMTVTLRTTQLLPCWLHLQMCRESTIRITTNPRGTSPICPRSIRRRDALQPRRHLSRSHQSKPTDQTSHRKPYGFVIALALRYPPDGRVCSLSSSEPPEDAADADLEVVSTELWGCDTGSCCLGSLAAGR